MSEPKLNGLILHYSLLTHRGIISDEHANRYTFCLTQCQINFEIKRGMRIQFKLNEKRTVTEIYRAEFTAFAQK